MWRTVFRQGVYGILGTLHSVFFSIFFNGAGVGFVYVPPGAVLTIKNWGAWPPRQMQAVPPPLSALFSSLLYSLTQYSTEHGSARFTYSGRPGATQPVGLNSCHLLAGYWGLGPIGP
jgi:hypothetical protein